MNLLLYGNIASGLPAPEFGGDFPAQLARKQHSDVQDASRSAWTLLERGLRLLGCDSLPDVHYMDAGKPYFPESGLHFSLSHSGNLAAALISDAPCALDAQQMLPEIANRLRDRCLSDAEQKNGMDFFECWTKKECIAKLSGKGLPARPSEMEADVPEYAGCFFTGVLDGYCITALCMNGEKPEIKKEDL